VDKDGDKVMSISKETKKKDRKRKNKNKSDEHQKGEEGSKRVRFDMS